LRRSATALFLAFFVAACGADNADEPNASALGDDAITVGSFDFAESELLAEIYSQALEGDGYEVQRAFSLGPREFVEPALADGLVEVVPEYAGTAVEFLSLGAEEPGSDAASAHDALVATLADGDVTALAPAPAQNANTFVVSRDTAARFDLESLSDLAAVAPELSFAGPPECAARRYCLAGLDEVYGVEFAEVVTLDAGGPLTHQALLDEAVDVALLFTTDPLLASDQFVELTDDRGLQPAENVTPLLHSDVVDHHGEQVTRVLNAVSARLTTADLRVLNEEVAATDDDVAAVARRWLEEGGGP
jgi:osmoprotectant transport system substrate-binding protein